MLLGMFFADEAEHPDNTDDSDDEHEDRSFNSYEGMFPMSRITQGTQFPRKMMWVFWGMNAQTSGQTLGRRFEIEEVEEVDEEVRVLDIIIMFLGVYMEHHMRPEFSSF